jgi:hypothetical protein
MIPVLLWFAILLQLLAAVAGYALGSSLGAGVAYCCLGLALLLAATALRQ